MQPEFKIVDHKGREITIRHYPSYAAHDEEKPWEEERRVILAALGLTSRDVTMHIADIEARGWPALADLLAGSR